jgi:hypothetical protein
MDNLNRARRAKEALALIDQGLAWLEEAAYEDKSESGDDLWWAVDRYNEAHHKACETDMWDDRGERVPSPMRAIKMAVKELGG